MVTTRVCLVRSTKSRETQASTTAAPSAPPRFAFGEVSARPGEHAALLPVPRDVDAECREPAFAGRRQAVFRPVGLQPAGRQDATQKVDPETTGEVVVAGACLPELQGLRARQIVKGRAIGRQLGGQGRHALDHASHFSIGNPIVPCAPFGLDL